MSSSSVTDSELIWKFVLPQGNCLKQTLGSLPASAIVILDVSKTGIVFRLSSGYHSTDGKKKKKADVDGEHIMSDLAKTVIRIHPEHILEFVCNVNSHRSVFTASSTKSIAIDKKSQLVFVLRRGDTNISVSIMPQESCCPISLLNSVPIHYDELSLGRCYCKFVVNDITTHLGTHAGRVTSEYMTFTLVEPEEEGGESYFDYILLSGTRDCLFVGTMRCYNYKQVSPPPIVIRRTLFRYVKKIVGAGLPTSVVDVYETLGDGDRTEEVCLVFNIHKWMDVSIYLTKLEDEQTPPTVTEKKSITVKASSSGTSSVENGKGRRNIANGKKITELPSQYDDDEEDWGDDHEVPASPPPVQQKVRGGRGDRRTTTPKMKVSRVEEDEEDE